METLNGTVTTPALSRIRLASLVSVVLIICEDGSEHPPYLVDARNTSEWR